MGVLFFIVFFLISLFIVGLVLLQEGKGGGLVGMSTGMDGVMGAKNPLRRMTAWLFVAFVIMAVFINWYFHQREDKVLPAGIGQSAVDSTRVLEESALSPGPVVLPDVAAEGSLRPEDTPETPVESVRPEGADEASVEPAQEPVESEPAEESDSQAPETTGELRPEPESQPATEPAPELRPEAPAENEATTQSVQPPAAE